MKKSIALVATATAFGYIPVAATQISHAFADDSPLAASPSPDEGSALDKAKEETRETISTIRRSIALTLNAEDQSYYTLMLTACNEASSALDEAKTADEARRIGQEIEQKLADIYNDATEQAVMLVTRYTEHATERTTDPRVQTKLNERRDQFLEQIRQNHGIYTNQESIFSPLRFDTYTYLAMDEREVAKEDLKAEYDRLLAGDSSTGKSYSEDELTQMKKVYDDAIQALDDLPLPSLNAVDARNAELIDSTRKSIPKELAEAKKALNAITPTAEPAPVEPESGEETEVDENSPVSGEENGEVSKPDLGEGSEPSGEDKDPEAENGGSEKPVTDNGDESTPVSPEVSPGGHETLEGNGDHEVRQPSPTTDSSTPEDPSAQPIPPVSGETDENGSEPGEGDDKASPDADGSKPDSESPTASTTEGGEGAAGEPTDPNTSEAESGSPTPEGDNSDSESEGTLQPSSPKTDTEEESKLSETDKSEEDPKSGETGNDPSASLPNLDGGNGDVQLPPTSDPVQPGDNSQPENTGHNGSQPDGDKTDGEDKAPAADENSSDGNVNESEAGINEGAESDRQEAGKVGQPSNSKGETTSKDSATYIPARAQLGEHDTTEKSSAPKRALDLPKTGMSSSAPIAVILSPVVLATLIRRRRR